MNVPCEVKISQMHHHGSTPKGNPLRPKGLDSLTIRHHAGGLKLTPEEADERCDRIERRKDFIDHEIGMDRFDINTPLEDDRTFYNHSFSKDAESIKKGDRVYNGTEKEGNQKDRRFFPSGGKNIWVYEKG